jgi:hypothetical protein
VRNIRQKSPFIRVGIKFSTVDTADLNFCTDHVSGPGLWDQCEKK